MFFAGITTVLLIVAAFNKVIDSEKSFSCDMIVLASVALVALIFGAIALNGINNAKDAEGCILYLFSYWFKIK